MKPADLSCSHRLTIPRSSSQAQDSLNLSGFVPRSEVNGPGLRAVVWVQGCSLHCPGCFNPDTHPLEPRWIVLTSEVMRWILGLDDIEGVTFSGGEPFEQAAPLASVAAACRGAGLGIMAYSGYTLSEILASKDEPRMALLSQLDILVDGRYQAGGQAPVGWRGSANQEVHFLTNRYSGPAGEPLDLPPPEIEIHVTADGCAFVTGFPTRETRREIHRVIGTPTCWR